MDYTYQFALTVYGLSIVTAGGGMVALWTSNRSHDTDAAPLWHMQLLTFGLYLVAVTISSFRSPFGCGCRTLSLLACIGSWLIGSAIKRRWTVETLRLLGQGAAILILYSWARSGGARPETFANPNELASVLVLVWPWSRGIGWELALLASMLATQARSVIVSVAVGLGIGRDWLTWRYAVAVLVLVVVLVAWRPGTITRRVEVWREAAGLWQQRPIWGWGYGAYSELAVIEPDKAHADNAIITAFAETGLVGVAAWCGVVAVAITRGLRSTSPARWALLAWLLQQTVEDTLTWPLTAIAVGLNLALL